MKECAGEVELIIGFLHPKEEKQPHNRKQWPHRWDKGMFGLISRKFLFLEDADKLPMNNVYFP